MLSDVLNQLAAAASHCTTKPKNCEQCLYRTEPWRDGGHCYMFREDFDSPICGSFIAMESELPLSSKITAAIKWLLSDEAASLLVADAKHIVAIKFGSDVADELQRMYGN